MRGEMFLIRDSIVRENKIGFALFYLSVFPICHIFCWICI